MESILRIQEVLLRKFKAGYKFSIMEDVVKKTVYINNGQVRRR